MPAANAFTIERVVKLLTHKNTADSRERHVAAITRLGKHYSASYSLSDMKSLCKVMVLAVEKAEGGMNPSYYQALGAAMMPLGNAYVRDKGTPVSEEHGLVVKLLSTIGETLVKVDDAALQNVLVGVVLRFFRGCAKRPDERQHDLDQRQRIYSGYIAESSLPVKLARVCIDIAAKQTSAFELDSVAVGSIFALAELTRHDAVTAKLVESGLLPRLLPVIANGRNEDIIGSGNEIFWNCVESPHEAEVLTLLGTDNAAHAFSKCFRTRLFAADGACGRQLRNDLLMVITLLVKGPLGALLAATPFVTDLLRGLTAPELKGSHPDCKKIKLGIGNEDFEFHRIALTLVQKLAKIPECQPHIEKSKLLLLLFAYLPKASIEAAGGKRQDGVVVRRWTPPQREELELLSIATLAAVIPYFPDAYKRLRGSTQLLDLFQWCTAERATAPTSTGGARTFRGAGNSTFSAGDFNLETEDRPNNGRRAHGLLCVKTLFNLAADAAEVREDLVDQGVLDQVLSFLDRGALTSADAFDLAVRTEGVNILTSLCEGELHVKELFGTTGVSTVLEYLSIEPKYFHQGLGHAEATVAAVALVWAAVAGCAMNESAFIEGEGIFHLLDLLDNGIEGSRNLVLGCLLDLCENERALPCVIEWRSSRDLEVTAAHLMVRIWRDEEATFGVAPAPGYIVPATDAPLMPDQWVPTGEGAGGRSIDEVSATQRSKVYALLSKTGWEAYPGLTATDRVTIESIRAYLTLKLGEVWMEIQANLATDGVVPTEADQDALDLALHANTEAVSQLRETQADILVGHEDRVEAELQKAYKEVVDNHRSTKVAEEKRVDFLGRTSNHRKLITATQRQAKQIDQSRALCAAPRHDAIDHRVEITADKLNTTAFGRSVALTGLLQPGTDGRELEPSDTRGVLESLPATVL
jgi:hypothetical protein